MAGCRERPNEKRDGAPDRGEIVSAMRTCGPTAPRLSKVPEKLLRSLLLGEVRELFPEEMSSWILPALRSNT